MQKKFLFFLITFFLCHFTNAQVSGNAVYSNQNNQYNINPKASKVQILNNSSMIVSGNILMNKAADYYIAIIGTSEEATTTPQAYKKLNRRIQNFSKKLKTLGIPDKAIYVDATTQNRIYEHFQENNHVVEKIVGFEVKKNIHIRYNQANQLEEILIKAAEEGIYDLVKVDYIVEDIEKIYDQLFDKAMSVIQKKKDKYLKLMNYSERKHPMIHTEQLNIIYPKDAYQKYQAFSTTNWSENSLNKERLPVKSARKMETYYFSKVNPVGFDKVINKGMIEPPVQFILHLQIKYDFE